MKERVDLLEFILQQCLNQSEIQNYALNFIDTFNFIDFHDPYF